MITLSPEPEVRLTQAFQAPFDNAIATARTCYSSRVIDTPEVAKDERSVALRDRIAEETYAAGHHTVFQHAHFQFALSKVSRQLCWSFLHAHPFYNSEQGSQRYVEVKPGNFLVPSLPEAERALFVAALERATRGYQQLVQLLMPAAEQAWFAVFPARRKEREKWLPQVKKKAQEIARYLLPVATHTHLYHSVSGLTLHRYHRLSAQLEVPEEARLVVGKMVAAVQAHDPLFFAHIEDPLPLEQTPEAQALTHFGLAARGSEARAFVDAFDAELGPWKNARLVDHAARGEQSVARAVRAVLGLTPARLSDAEAIARVMDPAIQRLHGETLVLGTLSKLGRTLGHAHFTFQKRLSHAADSQDQRHRMVPASRPVLLTQYAGRPDFVVPELFAHAPEARAFYEAELAELFGDIDRLLDAGIEDSKALYLLPNAFPIRFEETGDLLHLHHKWTARLCYTAQEEIWRASLEEVQQVQQVQPELGRWLGPPCHLRQRARLRPLCPEGSRYCGVPVWKLGLDQMERVI